MGVDGWCGRELGFVRVFTRVALTGEWGGL